jgi:hypothetical protein
VLLLRIQLAERLTDELLERVAGLWNACEGAFHLAFAEAHAGESLKRLRSRIGNGGSDGAAVARALGVGEIKV